MKTRKTRNPGRYESEEENALSFSFPGKRIERTLFRSQPGLGQPVDFLWGLTAHRQTNRSFVSRWPNKRLPDCFCLVGENSNRTSFYTPMIAYFVYRTVGPSMSRVQSGHMRAKIERTGVCVARSDPQKVFGLKTNVFGNIVNRLHYRVRGR